MEHTLYGPALAGTYDRLNDGVDYAGWADFVEACIRRYSDIPVKKVCEAACGTGSMACELARRGYEVTASDLSAEMLTAAEAKARRMALSVRFVLQDMRRLKMYDEKDLCLCTLDGINYLLQREDLIAAFSAAAAALKPGGLFLFDVNSKYKFETVYAENAYVLESDGVFCAWENRYRKTTRLCDFYLTIFTEGKNGTYHRTDEHQRERMYTMRQLAAAAAETGFSLCLAASDFDFTPADETRDERLYYILKKR